MISAANFRTMSLHFDQASEKPHFEKASFRIKAKIFATLDSAKKSATLKLTETDQSVYCLIRPVIAIPATGAWGKQGWTVFDLTKVSKSIMSEALKKAYANLAPKKTAKSTVSKKATPLIQTLHPDKSKTNKRISLDKYNTIKEALVTILQREELTHTALMERLYQQVKDSFEGGVQWYGETVKLDLEARKIIERTGTKPEKYRLKKRNR
jgi:hypothetical protein